MFLHVRDISLISILYVANTFSVICLLALFMAFFHAKFLF